MFDYLAAHFLDEDMFLMLQSVVVSSLDSSFSYFTNSNLRPNCKNKKIMIKHQSVIFLLKHLLAA